MTFIAFRESLLRFQRSKNPEYGLKDSQTMDIDQLWSSTLAGAGSGGILSALSRGPKSAPSGTFMFGALAFAGQWISSRASRYRQDQILAQSSFDDLSIPASSNSTSSSPSASQSQPALNTLLNVLPMHRTDLDEYEVKLRHKLERIEAEQQFLTQESLRRERLAVEKADQEKTV
ncbi:hypothetical protein BGW38_010772 [Lunasporangiospora selenospora]|uniref:Uncharacterized protein n=1 Tax=Lunasporangiospora selenospora TaxID=979761 RepID=A0A9P6KIG7_9FUNG|nr:hypothetical protein BGW38_010772 [Lunasporangiospora selenospora]